MQLPLPPAVHLATPHVRCTNDNIYHSMVAGRENDDFCWALVIALALMSLLLVQGMRSRWGAPFAYMTNSYGMLTALICSFNNFNFVLKLFVLWWWNSFHLPRFSWLDAPRSKFSVSNATKCIYWQTKLWLHRNQQIKVSSCYEGQQRQ